MKYKGVMLTKKGSPDVLQVVEQDLREPAANEVRIKVICTGVGFTDVIMRYGYYPYAPKIPFIPGYEIVGTIEAVGVGVTQVKVGDRVAALTVHGGYAEYIYLPPDNLVLVPEELDSVEAVSLILNYVTAYQMLHRTAKVQAGDSIFITGASGGVGNALLQLGKLAGLTMYGTASKSKHKLVEELGGIPIDYKSEDFVKVIKQKSGGQRVKAVFDAIGGAYVWKSYGLLQKKGSLVSFGLTGSIQNGKVGYLPLILGFGSYGLLKIIPDGKKAYFYGITSLYRKNPQPFKEDLVILFDLLKHGKIMPVIAERLPLLEAAKANRLLEQGNVNGKIVLVG